MRTWIVVAGVLQGLGTLMLSLFSFYGLQIAQNQETYLEGTPKVSIDRLWMRVARVGLLALLAGIVIGTFASYNATK